MTVTNYQHKEYAAGKWARMSLAAQMVNIGSEISRANKAKQSGNQTRVENAVHRTLELLSLSVDAHKNEPAVKEFLYMMELIGDYYLFDNEHNSTGEGLQKYFDDFIPAYLRERQASEQ